MIRVSSLTKLYGNTVGVEDLTFEVRDSSIFAFLGPNGAGKTTTLRMMAGLLSPSKGSVRIDEIEATKKENLAVLHKEIGILPEMAGHYESLSAYRNLEFYGRMYKMSESSIKESATELLKEFDLWRQREHSVGTFSKGMKQKLAIIRAVMHDPKYVFLDEPISGLDPEAARFVRDFMKKLRSDGKTVILSTHDLEDADRLSDTVAVIKGRLLVSDSPSELKKKLFKRTVVVHLKSPGLIDLDEVRAIPFVHNADLKDLKLVLEIEDPEENNPEIIDMLVKKGAKIQFVGEIRRTLEDVYLTVVDKNRGE